MTANKGKRKATLKKQRARSKNRRIWNRNNNVIEISSKKAGSVIHKLISFLGNQNVKRCLRRHNHALKTANTFYREHLKRRHPWLDGLEQYYELTSKEIPIHNNFTPELNTLATDAFKINLLCRKMPKSVKHKYSRDLLDLEHARNYLFELQTAWHFYSKLEGCSIHWYEADSTTRPEFLVKTPIIQFNVECKRISVDIARKIHRKDLYKLSDTLLPKIAESDFAGKLDLIMDNRLERKNIEKLCAKVIEIIDSGILKGNFEISPLGSVILDFHTASDEVINYQERANDFYDRNANNTHAVFLAKEKLHHIGGVGYASEAMIEKGSNYEQIFNSILFFRNHECKFESAKTFQFMSPPRF